LRKPQGSQRSRQFSKNSNPKDASNPGLSDNNSSSNNGDEEKQVKAARTVGILIGIFMVCWLPHLVIHTLLVFKVDFVPVSVQFFFYVLGNFNSCFNPFVYAKRSQDFQNAGQLMWNKLKRIFGK